MWPITQWGTGDGSHGQWGNSVQGVWGTGGICHGAYGQWGHRGYGVQGVCATWAMGVWGIWAMRPWVLDTGVWGTWAIGAQGYGVQRVWAMWAMGYRGMGHLGNGAYGRFAPRISKRCQVVKKMSCCQKNVKKSKHLDYGGGSQKN